MAGGFDFHNYFGSLRSNLVIVHPRKMMLGILLLAGKAGRVFCVAVATSIWSWGLGVVSIFKPSSSNIVVSCLFASFPTLHSSFPATVPPSPLSYEGSSKFLHSEPLYQVRLHRIYCVLLLRR